MADFVIYLENKNGICGDILIEDVTLEQAENVQEECMRFPGIVGVELEEQ